MFKVKGFISAFRLLTQSSFSSLILSGMAAEVGRDLRTRLLVLTHFSQRYMPVSDEYEVDGIRDWRLCLNNSLVD